MITNFKIFENNSSLRDKVKELLTKAKKDCYSGDENVKSINDLKDIISVKEDYDLGCSDNSIELSGLDAEYIMDVLDLSDEQLSLMISGEYSYQDYYNDLKNYNNVFKEINSVFNVDEDRRIVFDIYMTKGYRALIEDVNYIYEQNVYYQVIDIRDKLFFEFETDVIRIFPDLIESNEETIIDAIYEQCNKVNIDTVGNPELSDIEKKELDKKITDSLNEILDYCKTNKQKIIDEVCIIRDNDRLPNLYVIQNYGGDFLKLIKSFEYQKNKITNPGGSVIDKRYDEFKRYGILNQKMIDYKNMKIQTKKFKI